MRSLGLVAMALAGVAFGQGLTEYGAAAAGASAGSAAGKKVSDGITAVFGKVDQTAKDASKSKAPVKQRTAADVAPASGATPGANPGAPAGATAAATARPKTAAAKPRPALKVRPEQIEDDSTVPPPPPAPLQRAAVVKVETPAPAPVVQAAPPPPPPPPPAAPHASVEDLKNVAMGTRRADLLKLGAPASRITMFDSGHLLEIYHYTSREQTIAVVRLNDGAVASVEMR